MKNPSVSPGGYREVWPLAYPVIITMASRTVMGFVDTAMVGRLGASELAAVGLSGILTWSLFSFFNGLLTSVNTFVAQHHGAGNRRGATVAAWQGIYIAIGASLAVLLISGLTGRLFAVMKPSTEVQQLGIIYTKIRLYGGISLFVHFSVAGFLRGIGDTKTPMWIEIGANLLNVLLDYLLIFGHYGCPRLEVAGAAIATVISGFIAVAIYLAVFLSGKCNRIFQTRSHFQVDLSEIRRNLRIGVPMGFQNVLDMGSFVVFTAMIGRMGDVALAANTASLTLLSMSFMPVFGISMAATTLVGQYVGASQLPNARKSGYTAIKIGIACTFVFAIVFFTVPNLLFSLISDDPEVIALGKDILILAAIFQLSHGFGLCAVGALKGAGDTLFPMLVGIGFAWLLFLPLAYGFGVALGYGVVGAWGGATIHVLLRSIIYLMRFRGNRWERITI